MHKTALILILVAISGCQPVATFTYSDKESDLTTVHLTVEYGDEDGNRFADYGDKPDRVVLTMPLIVGQLAGVPQTETLAIRHVAIGESTKIDLIAYKAQIENYATSLLLTESTRGTEIFPKSAKLARLATFAFDPITGDFIGPTGFRLIESRESVSLAYFTKPCRITGTAFEGDMPVEYEVVIDAPGFHWISSIKRGDGGWYVSTYKGSESVVLHIQIATQDTTKET